MVRNDDGTTREWPRPAVTGTTAERPLQLGGRQSRCERHCGPGLVRRQKRLVHGERQRGSRLVHGERQCRARLVRRERRLGQSRRRPQRLRHVPARDVPQWGAPAVPAAGLTGARAAPQRRSRVRGALRARRVAPDAAAIARMIEAGRVGPADGQGAVVSSSSSRRGDRPDDRTRGSSARSGRQDRQAAGGFGPFRQGDRRRAPGTRRADRSGTTTCEDGSPSVASDLTSGAAATADRTTGGGADDARSSPRRDRDDAPDRATSDRRAPVGRRCARWASASPPRRRSAARAARLPLRRPSADVGGPVPPTSRTR